jgi:hypothetical protein
LAVCGEIYGKTQAQTQSGQQETARPLENPAQNKLIIGDASCVLSVASGMRKTQYDIRNTTK